MEFAGVGDGVGMGDGVVSVGLVTVSWVVAGYLLEVQRIRQCSRREEGVVVPGAGRMRPGGRAGRGREGGGIPGVVGDGFGAV